MKKWWYLVGFLIVALMVSEVYYLERQERIEDSKSRCEKPYALFCSRVDTDYDNKREALRWQYNDCVQFAREVPALFDTDTSLADTSNWTSSQYKGWHYTGPEVTFVVPGGYEITFDYLNNPGIRSSGLLMDGDLTPVLEDFDLQCGGQWVTVENDVNQ